MIFVAVGTQLPFDRLVKAVDDWAATIDGCEIFGQVGASSYRAKNIETVDFLTPSQFQSCVRRASLIVSHAGMGTIITALERGRPILVMPRRACLGEHRNDHQVATAVRLGALGRITVALDEREIEQKLTLVQLSEPEKVGDRASAELLRTIRFFVQASSGKRF
jgi:UDP-N-acetylglucosamine transferase subunit ALG13